LKNKSNETLSVKHSFLENSFDLIKIQQKYCSDGFYKTQVQSCQLIATIRILPSIVSLALSAYCKTFT